MESDRITFILSERKESHDVNELAFKSISWRQFMSRVRQQLSCRYTTENDDTNHHSVRGEARPRCSDGCRRTGKNDS